MCQRIDGIVSSVLACVEDVALTGDCLRFSVRFRVESRVDSCEAIDACSNSFLVCLKSFASTSKARRSTLGSIIGVSRGVVNHGRANTSWV